MSSIHHWRDRRRSGGGRIRGEWAYAFTSGLPDSLGLGKLSRIERLAPESIREPLCRVQIEAVETVLERAASKLGDPLAALEAMVERPRAGLARYLLASQPSLGDAFDQLERFRDLFVDARAVELRACRRSAAVTLLPRDAACAERVTEACLLHIVLQLHAAAGRAVGVTRVLLPGPARAEPGRYERIFGARVYFDQLAPTAILDPECLQERLDRESERVASVAEAAARLEFEIGTCTTVRDRVETLLRSHLKRGQALSRDAAARRLVQSPRSLERQLRREDTSFREIEESVRRRFAVALVTESEAPLEALAIRCGFANLPAFSRAFRRWTGAPPSRFRRASQQPSEPRRMASM